MLGLRSNGRFAGATRLLDEWLTGLEAFWASGPVAVTDDVAGALLGGAAARVRKFARRGGALEPLVPDALGLIRFELQGFDYVARAEHLVPTSVASLDAVDARLREGLASVVAHAGPEEQAIFALVLAPRSTTPITGADFVTALHTLRVSGTAWAFPGERDPFGHRAVDAHAPGLALVLAWSGDDEFEAAPRSVA